MSTQINIEIACHECGLELDIITEAIDIERGKYKFYVRQCDDCLEDFELHLKSNLLQ